MSAEIICFGNLYIIRDDKIKPQNILSQTMFGIQSSNPVTEDFIRSRVKISDFDTLYNDKINIILVMKMITQFFFKKIT